MNTFVVCMHILFLLEICDEVLHGMIMIVKLKINKLQVPWFGYSSDLFPEIMPQHHLRPTYSLRHPQTRVRVSYRSSYPGRIGTTLYKAGVSYHCIRQENENNGTRRIF